MKKRWSISILLVSLLIPFSYGTFEIFPESSGAFSSVMSESISIQSNPRLVEIAMLGAHDAFSSEIHLFSKVDPAEEDGALVANPLLRVFFGGLFVRLARTQTQGTEMLLQRGVRYFDVRLSYDEGQWVTKHGLISHPLERDLIPLVQFLKTHPGECILFDMQHVYLANQTWGDLFDYIEGVKVEGVSLLDFVHVRSNITSIGSVTYEDATDSRTSGGAILLAGTEEETSLYRHYDRRVEANTIRSVWHETSNLDRLLERIQAEHETLQAMLPLNSLVVNQAQRTGVLSSEEWMTTLFGWSLLSMAAVGNAKLLKHENVSDWFETMPILMVDFSTSGYQNFNVLANEAIIAYNLTL